MNRVAQYLRSAADYKIKKGVPPPNSPLTQKIKQGDKSLRDSGALASSIAAHHDKYWADASTNKKYAKIQQEGGTIKPRKAQSLWIPAGPMTRTLMKRYGALSPKDLINAMKSDGYTFFFTPLSKVYMAQKGKRSKPFALFIVRSSIKIPARPFLYHDKGDEINILAIINNGMIKEFRDRHKESIKK